MERPQPHEPGPGMVPNVKRVRPYVDGIRYQANVAAVVPHLVEQIARRRGDRGSTLEQPPYAPGPPASESRQVSAVQREHVRLTKQVKQHAHSFREKKGSAAKDIDLRDVVAAP